jgi:hypothetical protein
LASAIADRRDAELAGASILRQTVYSA